ncbi:MAG: hydroxymethylglutaryl-CoA lyase [Azospirillum sp.]|nr:hydroxymethylglutaryl-CoA lyase [Azospirillum sp.]MCA3267797.1 hydroxymethylglutaryl-CoA lyase [Azospirillum sp.]MCZ8123571.1 hydroxymethylglutaryl-CoA lyase [Magnetospirillum sp.]
MSDPDILISEVGPRDGLQNTKIFMPTEAKKRWISALAAAGLREIEVCSFVNPKLIAQFSDADEVVAHAVTLPNVAVVALVPNFKGAERAAKTAARKISLPISASEAHSVSNVRKTIDEQVAELSRIVELRRAGGATFEINGGISTAFGCTIQGEVKQADVLRLVERVVAAGADSVSIADTVGYANPKQVREVFAAARRIAGAKLDAAHFHNTRGLGLANCLAAIEVGVRSLDSSMAGLGGCPYAPGASGNVITEDLVFMLESMGLKTGIDFAKLLDARRVLEDALPGAEFHGHLAKAGLPKGFKEAA